MSPGSTLDVAVVGAGPAGSRTAELLSAAGLEVTVLEEHREIGHPVQCAGLFSRRVFDLLGDEVAVENRVSGARVHAPDGRVVAFDAGQTRALVVDRAAFDRHLAETAVREGADLRVGCRVLRVRSSNAGCTLEVLDRAQPKGTAREEVRCRLVVGADGPGSAVRRSTGIPTPKQHLTAFQYRFATRKAMDPSTVDLFGGREIAPGFFAWVIPLGEHQGLVGLAAEPGGHSPRARLDALIRRPAFRASFPDIQPISAHAGIIPLGPIHRPIADGVVLVGDAAAQAKATSGGGVYPALEASGMASRTIVRMETSRRGHSRPTLAPSTRRWVPSSGAQRAYGAATGR